MRSRQSGFTLVEIAIVLVIIGLLLGGVLKGQELINSAKIKNLVNDMNGISTAVYGYQDRFKALPGDDPTAATRWTGTTSGDGNTVLATGTTLHSFNSATATNESRLFWQHLRLAGFVGGDTVSTSQPLNAVGGIMGVQSGAGNQTVATDGTQGLAGLVVCQTNILGRIAESLDNQLDDGKPNGGGVRSWTQTGLVAADGATTAVDIRAVTTGGPSPAASYVDDGNTMYTVCKKVI
jgi:prepilin-type N-terminal cleavage/methylation domain-containing protein